MEGSQQPLLQPPSLQDVERKHSQLPPQYRQAIFEKLQREYQQQQLQLQSQPQQQQQQQQQQQYLRPDVRHQQSTSLASSPTKSGQNEGAASSARKRVTSAPLTKTYRLERDSDSLSTTSSITGLSRAHWKPDSSAPVCTWPGCYIEFGLFDRRHHCRKCGDIFCSTHCSKEVPLDYSLEFNPEDGVASRACVGCFEAFEQWKSPVSFSSASAFDRPLEDRLATGSSSREDVVHGDRDPAPAARATLQRKNTGQLPEGFLGGSTSGEAFGREDIVRPSNAASGNIAIKKRPTQENEVDGRVLLMNMDHGALKDEFSVKAFGKRAKILDAIANLRVVAKKQEVTKNLDSARTFTVSTPLSILDMGGLRLSEDAPLIHRPLPILPPVQSPRQREAVFRRGGSPSDRDYAPIPLLDVPLRIWKGVAPNAQDQKASLSPSQKPLPQTGSVGSKSRTIQEEAESDDDEGSVSLGSDDDDDDDEEDRGSVGYDNATDESSVQEDQGQDVDGLGGEDDGATYDMDTDVPVMRDHSNGDRSMNRSDIAATSVSSLGKQTLEPAPVQSTVRRIAPALVQPGLIHRPLDRTPSLALSSSSGNMVTTSSNGSLDESGDPGVTKNYFLSAIEAAARVRKDDSGVAQSPITSTSDELHALSLSPSLSMEGNDPAKRRKSQKKKPYFEGGKLSLSEIFLGSETLPTENVEDEEDGDDDWAMVSSRSQERLSCNPGRRHVIQKNMLRVLRDPPFFDIPGYTAYAPLRRGEKDVPVLLYPRLKPGNNNGKARRSTWDKTFPDPKKRTTTARIELEVSGEDMTSFDFSAFGSGVPHEQPTAAAILDDPVLPLYGDSDASAYTTDEELFREVAREEKDLARPPRSKRVLPPKATLSEPEVRAAVEGYIADYKMLWEQNSLPSLEKKRYHHYQGAANPEGLEKSLAKSNAEFKQISEKRLKSVLDAMTETSYKSVTEVRQKCKAMDETLRRLCYLQWEIDLLAGPPPDPPSRRVLSKLHSPAAPSMSSPVGPSKKARNIPEDLDSQQISEIDEDSGADYESDLSDLIDDSGVIQIEDTDGDVTMDADFLPSTKVQAPIQQIRSKEKSRKQHSEGSSSQTAKATVIPREDAGESDKRHKAGSSIVNDTLAPETQTPQLPPRPRSTYIRNTENSLQPFSRRAEVVRHDASQSSSPQEIRPKSTEEQDLDIHIDGFRSTPAPSNANETPSTSRESSVALEKEGVIPATFRAVETQHWIHLFKSDDEIIKELRSLRRYVCCLSHRDNNPIAQGWREPWMSIYQEYIEWIELGVSEETGIKMFLKWRRNGNDVTSARAAKAVEALAQYRAEKQARAKEALKKASERKQNLNAARAEQTTKEDAKDNMDMDLATPNKDISKKDIPKKDASKEDTAERGGFEKSSLKNGTSEKSASEKETCEREGSIQRKRCITPPNAIMIDSSDSDSSNIESLRRRIGPKPRKFIRKESKPIESETSFLTASADNEKSSRSRETTGGSRSGEDEDMPIRRKTKKRARRKYFGDSSQSDADDDEDDDDDDDDDDGDDDISLKGKKKARTEVAEAEDVLRLREDLAKRDKEIQERIKIQEARGLILKSNSKDGEVLINPGHKDTESPVTIPLFFSQHMKPHQIDGVRFMWRNVVMLESGCILAHAMGLGKTFQVIVFLYVLLREILFKNENIPKYLSDGRVLLLVPPIVIDNWQSEFIKWIPAEELEVVRVWVLPTAVGKRDVMSRYDVMHDWHNLGGILLLSYSMFRTYSTPTKLEPETEVLNRIQAFLTSPGPSITVADEGHVLKNEKAKLSVASKRIKSKARVILTGYPLQNRLEEYWCMVDFIRPNYLGELNSFRSNFINPIERGLFTDSHVIERKASSKKLRVLTELIGSFVLRKDQSVLRASLPKKIEYVISCRLTRLQTDLYEQFLLSLGSVESAVTLLGNGHIFLTICNHPAAFRAASRVTKNAAIIRGCVDELSNVENGSPMMTGASAVTAGTISGSDAASSNEATIQAAAENGEAVAEAVESNLAMNDAMKSVKSSTIWDQIISHYTKDLNDVTNSYKMVILLDILTACRAIKEKVLVFTRNIPTIDFIEFSVKNAGFKSMTLDGSTAVTSRQSMIDDFNDTDNYDLFLISTGAGSVGVNLVSASRVVIFDVGWNPSHDEQAIARAFRYGQTRKVYVYRLQTFGTFEDLLYKNNLHKLGLANRVIDKKTIKSNTFSKTQMKQYFRRPPAPSETPVWVTKENVEDLFNKPDTEDTVLRTVIEKNKESLTFIVPQNELIRELDSDLTEADMEDIRYMISQEQRRIEGKPFDSSMYMTSPPMMSPFPSSATNSPIPASGFPVPGNASAAVGLQAYGGPQRPSQRQPPPLGTVQGPPISVAASKRERTKEQVLMTLDELQALAETHRRAMARDPTISRTEQTLQQRGRTLTDFEREQERSVLLAQERINAIVEHQNQGHPAHVYAPSLFPPNRNAFRGYSAAIQPEHMVMPPISRAGSVASTSAATSSPVLSWSMSPGGARNNMAAPGNRIHQMSFRPLSQPRSFPQQQEPPTVALQNQNLQPRVRNQGQTQSQSPNQNPRQNETEDQGQSSIQGRGQGAVQGPSHDASQSLDQHEDQK
ncbi:hypothetical protein EMPS_09464 [Entomortierella parvispora]|uniref:Uncharacterized protein n=1 Tax=Entomortierella parvispora TaxID=205924 RepID=A0A9P3HIB8_9FUNG|nr:hypothetical protein EMPS_09464 [Entomortierella parvispora]